MQQKDRAFSKKILFFIRAEEYHDRSDYIQSQTGHTRAYAELLSEEIGIPSYDIGEALTMIPKGAPIIFELDKIR